MRAPPTNALTVEQKEARRQKRAATKRAADLEKQQHAETRRALHSAIHAIVARVDLPGAPREEAFDFSKAPKTFPSPYSVLFRSLKLKVLEELADVLWPLRSADTRETTNLINHSISLSAGAAWKDDDVFSEWALKVEERNGKKRAELEVRAAARAAREAARAARPWEDWSDWSDSEDGEGGECGEGGEGNGGEEEGEDEGEGVGEGEDEEGEGDAPPASP